ncbi:branched-chain amino acid transport system substrate-binding protein [Nocardioides luteus]|uniref:ABC transporter substrate-binding protein n=1 Tax=Nocardioides luteus TaxID=1844 RepID=A0ABQ5T2H0_9ACTN|nr:ABC transporter substrate-binding protein [Nocardioides luteus]MDR7311644.1 branched-chain amino acid transport system substrate-binding protein [Nocardioides luteus]GGR54246.1 ABC transporter substrate-binding protein [Nocardioides luteus]GLJ70294.1 ABC transporter substrate-binding protein [Nocardioides luteus]
MTVSARRQLSVLATISALLLGLEACGTASDTEVSIGLVVPTSGPYRSIGSDMARGFDLYLDQHDGMLGGRTVDLVRADEGEGAKTGVPAVTKVIEEDEVHAVVGVLSSETAAGAKKVAEENETPLVITGASADGLADGSDYLWRTSSTNARIGGSLGKAVARETDLGETYVIASDDASGHEFSDSFMIAFEASGGSVSGQSYTPAGVTDEWSGIFEKAEESGADAIYAAYIGTDAVSFVRHYRASGVAGKIPLYGPGFLTEGDALTGLGGAATGVRTSLHYSDTMDSLMNDAFVKDYRKAYDSTPTVYSVQAYDAAAALDKALALSPDVTREEIADSLGSIGTIISPRGNWSFDPKHNPAQSYFLRVVKGTPEGPRNVVVSKIASAGT